MKEEVIFKALADPVRIRLIESIAKRKGCVKILGQELKKRQPNVSQHLRILRMAGIVKPKRNGKEVFYCLQDKRVLRLIEAARRLDLHDRSRA